VVIDEASLGDPQEVQKRLAVIDSLPVLEVTEDAESLAEAIIASRVLRRCVIVLGGGCPSFVLPRN